DPRIFSVHLRKLTRLIREHNIIPKAIANLDEKEFLMGHSKQTMVVTGRGR
ncbi:hypothetical protein BDD12DRAFT_633756, partial [Trichophaea hybrida]